MLKNVINFFKSIYYKVLNINYFYQTWRADLEEWRRIRNSLLPPKNYIPNRAIFRFFDLLRDKKYDLIYEITRRVVRFFWYLDFLERFFDVIEHVCYYWIKVPYQRYENHFYTVILPPIREKYIKWRSKKHSRFRLFRRKQRVLIYNYIKARW